MKTVMQYLSLLLCFELIVAPVAGSLVMSSPALAQETTCPQGQEFNSELNRCTLTANVISTKENADYCRKIENEEERKNCYKNNATNITNEARDEEIAKCNAMTDSGDRKKCLKKYDERRTGHLRDGGKATTGNIVSSAATVALPLLFMIKALADGKKFNQCKPASLLLMYGGGAALLVGEVVSFIQHAGNIKKMEEARKSLTVTENADNSDDNKVIASNAQSQAFELLAVNEDSIAKVAKTKKITYGIATSLFAAGAIMGTIETFQYNMAKTQLANPQTAVAAQATLTRLTCGSYNTTKEENESIAKGKELEKQKLDEQKNLAKDANGKEAKDPGSIAGDKKGFSIDSIISVVTMGAPMAMMFINKAPSQAPAPAPSTPTTTPGTEDQKAQSCGEGQQWSVSKQQCIQISAVEMNEILNLKYKKRAAQNIRHAKNYFEIMELLAEAESMDFESISRPSYHEDSFFNDSLKAIPFHAKAAELISDFFIGKAVADDEKPYLTTGKDGKPVNTNTRIGDAKSKVGQIMDKAVYTPQGRLITNGLLGTWMGIMTSHMVKQERISKERAALLRKMKTEFESQGGIATCTSGDRTDPGKPACYCFTADNQPNPSTMNNKVCDMTLAKLKNEIEQNTAGKVCVNQNMVAETNCACRRTNTCVRVPTTFKMSGISPGTFKMLSSATTGANGLLNGNTDTGSMDAGSIGSNAARLKDAADKAIAKDPKLQKKSNDLAQALMASSAGIPMSGPGYSSGSSSLPSSPKAAAAALDKEIKDSKGEAEITTAGNKNAGGGFQGDIPEEPEFGMNTDMLAAQETEIAEVMGQEMDLGSNADINSGSKTNIFDVLSNRYRRSGMRRLFDENNKTKADEAAATDIAQ